MQIFSLIFLIFSFNTLAVSLKSGDISKISMEIPYTMGKHKLNAKSFKGEIDWDAKSEEIKGGEFKLAIANIQAEKSELKCHLQEALGLDYKVSEFPESHVCNDEDKLPSEGPSSIKYPEITANLLSPLKMGENEAKVRWEIHGKMREIIMPITVFKNGDVISLKSNWEMKLSDYDIIVKKFLFIAVKDDVTLNLTMSLSQK